MKMLLQFYEDKTFGYKGVDDCENELLLKQVDHGRVLFEQEKDEDRETFFNRVSERPNNHEYGSDEIMDSEVNNEDWTVRIDIAEMGYSLDKLVNDENWYVRTAVAKQGYGLDKLIDDEIVVVRATVADQGYGLDRLVNDESKEVRLNVAKQGYGLDKLVDDKNSDIRRAVAEQGYGLNKLVNDENWFVREAVLNYVKINNVPLNDLIVINEDFNNEYFTALLMQDVRQIFFNKYFEQFVRDNLPQMKRDKYFDEIVKLCNEYNSNVFKREEISELLDKLSSKE